MTSHPHVRNADVELTIFVIYLIQWNYQNFIFAYQIVANLSSLLKKTLNFLNGVCNHLP